MMRLFEAPMPNDRRTNSTRVENLSARGNVDVSIIGIDLATGARTERANDT